MKKIKIIAVIIICNIALYIACKKPPQPIQPVGSNTAPVVNAGNDTMVIHPDNFAFLKGTFTDNDSSFAKILWTVIQKPPFNIDLNIENPYSLFTKVSKLVTGKYKFQITVTDRSGLSGKDTVEINIPYPVISAGNSQIIMLPITEARLSGSTVLSPDRIIKKEWKKVSGPKANIVNPNEFISQVTDLEEGHYLFELSVTDTAGIIRKAQSGISVKQTGKPNVQISPPYTLVYTPTNFILLSAYTTSNYLSHAPIIKIEWTKISGTSNFTIESPLNKDTKISGLQQGVYEIKCEVTDSLGKTASDTTTIAVADSSTPNQEIIIPDVPWIYGGGGFSCNYMEDIKIYNYIPAGKPIKKVYIKSNCGVDWVEVKIILTSPPGIPPVYEYNVVAGVLLIEHCNDGCWSDPSPDIKIVY